MHYATGSICSRTPFLPDSYPFVLIGRLPDQRAVRHKPGGRRARSEKKRRRARISACEDECGPIVSQADRAQKKQEMAGTNSEHKRGRDDDQRAAEHAQNGAADEGFLFGAKQNSVITHQTGFANHSEESFI